MRFFVGMFALLGCLVTVPADAAQKKKDVVVAEERKTPPLTTDTQNLLLLDLSTGGRVTIWLRPDVAPLMVERIKTLTRQHFYDGLAFHRVIDGFMAQGGDPKGDGTGGSTLPDLKAEFNYLPHVRGAVSAARSDKEDSANSQFFIVFQPRLSLDKKYTVFGRVIDGMQYVDSIERGEPPANPSRIVHAYIAADNPPAYVAGPPAPALGAPVTLPGTASGPDVAAPKLAPAARKAPSAKPAVKKAPAKK
jgi:cyclophilin family peptidyl-prolyl cis-trans isomerase